MKIVSKMENRIENMLKKDKEDVSSTFLTLLKSEIYSVMSNYCLLFLSDVKIGCFVDKDGIYHFKFEVLTNRFKSKSIL